MSDGGADARDFPCDLCGSDDPIEIQSSRSYTGGQPIHVCRQCGFVYVRRRRAADAIADAWTDEIFGSGYTARIPAVTGRLTYVAETVAAEIGLEGKDVCEIGAGEGEFLELAAARGARPFGIEPSPANCARIESLGYPVFQGTIEAYEESAGELERFDVVTILWTLENCQDCRRMLAAANQLLRPGGHVVVATGSRILVPFKKPLWTYFSENPADTHSFRFSARTLAGLLAVSELEPAFVNRHLDHDVLCVIGQKVAPGTEIPWAGDDFRDVLTFFERWHADTAVYYPRG
ncbi:MAG: class I SAM-dependent methyltransferase [Gaiellaceae bacterium]